MQVENLRTLYEKTNGKAVCTGEPEDSLVPKWEYVEWLEGLLFKYAQHIFKELAQQHLTGDKGEPEDITPNCFTCIHDGTGYRECLSCDEYSNYTSA